MLNLVKVAVTGGLACGKSSVCRLFKDLGAFTVDADEIVHQQLSLDTALGQQVLRLLGKEIVVNHQIDRSLIAKKVFKQPQLLHSLEKLVHPEVKRELETLYQRINSRNEHSLFVVEAPLLFEAGGKRWFDYDYSIAVVANELLCQKRFQERGSGGIEEYEQRAKRQLNSEEKAERADFIITNNGTLSDLYNQVKTLYNKMFNLS